MNRDAAGPVEDKPPAPNVSEERDEREERKERRETPAAERPSLAGADSSQSVPGPEQPGTRRQERGSNLSSWARDMAISVIVSTFIIVFLYQPVRVEGTSMLPMLEDQDRLFINKMAYRVGEIHRGDVVVFQYPHDHQKSYIKRVIALPGDDLRIDHGRVYVNGQQIAEKYVPLRFEDDRSQPEEIIAPNQYFVMGDHRSISSDSRDFGAVDRPLIYGKAAFVYWPMEQVGVVR